MKGPLCQGLSALPLPPGERAGGAGKGEDGGPFYTLRVTKKMNGEKSMPLTLPLTLTLTFSRGAQILRKKGRVLCGREDPCGAAVAPQGKEVEDERTV